MQLEFESNYLLEFEIEQKMHKWTIIVWTSLDGLTKGNNEKSLEGSAEVECSETTYLE